MKFWPLAKKILIALLTLFLVALAVSVFATEQDIKEAMEIMKFILSSLTGLFTGDKL